MDMEIAALSMAMAQNDVSEKVGIAMLDKSLDFAQSEGADLVSMISSAGMERSVNPAVGGTIDISV